MEESKESIKLLYCKVLPHQNFSTNITLQIDNSVKIKTILNLENYIYDEKTDCANGKAIISGRIGTKVVYIDQDNITNTLTDNQPFTETVVDQSITAESFLCITSSNATNTIISNDGSLKLNCETSLGLTVYLNLGLDTTANSFENMITKKTELKTCAIQSPANSNFDYTSTIETKEQITKVLTQNSYLTIENTTPNNGFVTIEGKMLTCALVEINENEETKIRELSDCFNIKTDVEMPECNESSMVDLCFFVNRDKERINTEQEADNTTLVITNNIGVKGVVLNQIAVDLVDDMYSLDNDLELTYSSRETIKDFEHFKFSEKIYGENSITSSEPAIEEVVSTCAINSELTNYYLKDQNLYVEGVLTCNIIYIDENKEYNEKTSEIPFVINSKFNPASIDFTQLSCSVTNCKTKAKRGTILETECELEFACTNIQKETVNLVSSITVGKPVDNSQYDYQIFLAKPNETTWQLSKRIKISPEQLASMNKDLPAVMQGGEKIIIKR